MSELLHCCGREPDLATWFVTDNYHSYWVAHCYICDICHKQADWLYIRLYVEDDERKYSIKPREYFLQLAEMWANQIMFDNDEKKLNRVSENA